MKIFHSHFALISAFFVFTSCDKTAKGLTPLNNNWKEIETTFWVKNNDSIYKEIKSIESLDKLKYLTNKHFEIQLNDKLKIAKSILFNPDSNKKSYESDTYLKRINSDVRSKIHLSYDYELKKYSITFYDSIATLQKKKKNRVKLDSIRFEAKKNDLYLCGTLAHEILMEGLPDIIIEEISLESAQKIIEN